jgi:Bacteriophage head to tail connecting protein
VAQAARSQSLDAVRGQALAAGMPSGKWATDRDWSVLRKQVDSRLRALEVYRYSWWVHWRDLADYILPRRYKWLITPNLWNKGAPINQRIIDDTGTLAFRTLAAGMMSGITSPGRPWMRITTTNDDLNENPDVRDWLSDSTDRIRRVMASSNYYTAKAVQYFDLGVFGTAPLLIYEDTERVIRCFNPRAGEYYVAAGKSFTVDTLYRKYTMTVDEIVKEFGVDACSDQIMQMYANDNLDQELVICHAIETNPEWTAAGYAGLQKTGVPRMWRWREVYWQFGAGNREGKGQCLRVAGYHDQPFSCPRWDAEGNDAYGRSPAMDALGDIKMLQVMQKRLAQGIDKMINPPMMADPSMKNEPASLLPGAVTYVPTLAGQYGFKPIFQVTPPVNEMIEAIKDTRERIRETAFNNLFLMISQLDTVRSATEIDARKEEKLVQLGPVLERFNTEGLDPDVNRIFRIMWRGGMFRPMPSTLHGVSLKIEYISILADTQRATNTSSLERLVQFVGNISGAHPEALDTIDWDETINTYADLLLVPPKVLTDARTLAALRKNRAQQQQMQNALPALDTSANAAKTLSQTDVGGGQNALQQMFSGLSAANGNAPTPQAA